MEWASSRKLAISTSSHNPVPSSLFPRNSLQIYPSKLTLLRLLSYVHSLFIISHFPALRPAVTSSSPSIFQPNSPLPPSNCPSVRPSPEGISPNSFLQIVFFICLQASKKVPRPSRPVHSQISSNHPQSHNFHSFSTKSRKTAPTQKPHQNQIHQQKKAH
jgi:hypothetical protein